MYLSLDVVVVVVVVVDGGGGGGGGGGGSELAAGVGWLSWVAGWADTWLMVSYSSQQPGTSTRPIPIHRRTFRSLLLACSFRSLPSSRRPSSHRRQNSIHDGMMYARSSSSPSSSPSLSHHTHPPGWPGRLSGHPPSSLASSLSLSLSLGLRSLIRSRSLVPHFTTSTNATQLVSVIAMVSDPISSFLVHYPQGSLLHSSAPAACLLS